MEKAGILKMKEDIDLLSSRMKAWGSGKGLEPGDALARRGISWYGLVSSRQFLSRIASDPEPWLAYLDFLAIGKAGFRHPPGPDVMDRLRNLLNELSDKLFMQGRTEKAAALFSAVCRSRHRDHEASHSFKYLNRVNFEITSVCNLHCKYCTFRSGARKSFIEVPLFRKVLKEISEKWPELRRLALYMSGESLMHPKFIEILEAVREIKDSNPRFQPQVYLHTNGMLWTPDMNDRIIGTGALDRVVWSIDGIDRESFEDMRPGAKYDIVLNNFEYFLLNRPRNILADVNRLVERRHRNCPPDPRLAMLLRLASNVSVVEPKELNEHKRNDWDNTWIGDSTSFCEYVFHSVVVTTSGQMSLCCVDYNSLNAFGDLNHDSFEETYFGARRKMLEKMAASRRSELPGCKTCRLLRCAWNTDTLCKGSQHIAHLKKTLKELMGKDGVRSIAVFGAGSHSAWLERAIKKNKRVPKIVAVLDDNVQGKRRVFGRKPQTAKGFNPKSVDAILLSSDCFQAQMKKRCIELYGEDVKLIDLYEGLPPGPYPKS